MSLPKFKTKDPVFTLLQTQWAALLDPILKQPSNEPIILKNIILSSSSVINHRLNRPLIGWDIIRLRGNATVYDIQDTNIQPSKTLLLVSSSGVSADILVF